MVQSNEDNEIKIIEEIELDDKPIKISTNERRRLYSNKRYKEDPEYREKRKEISRIYYLKNKEKLDKKKLCENSKRYYIGNREKVIQSKQKYYEEHKQKCQEYGRQYSKKYSEIRKNENKDSITIN